MEREEKKEPRFPDFALFYPYHISPPSSCLHFPHDFSGYLGLNFSVLPGTRLEYIPTYPSLPCHLPLFGVRKRRLPENKCHAFSTVYAAIWGNGRGGRPDMSG